MDVDPRALLEPSVVAGYGRQDRCAGALHQGQQYEGLGADGITNLANVASVSMHRYACVNLKRICGLRFQSKCDTKLPGQDSEL